MYDARDPDEIGLVPLGKAPQLLPARDYYDQLCRDAEHERQLKKRNQLSGLHKSVERLSIVSPLVSLCRYLTLLQDQTELPCLADGDRYMISLSPLTNVERSKLSSTSESIFVEITSGHSMDTCRRVMDAFLRRVLANELTKISNDDSFRQVLVPQQTRVVDEKR